MTKEGTTRITLRIPAQIKEWFEKKAEDRGISQNAQIILSLEAQMQQDKAVACGEPPEEPQNVR